MSFFFFFFESCGSLCLVRHACNLVLGRVRELESSLIDSKTPPNNQDPQINKQNGGIGNDFLPVCLPSSPKGAKVNVIIEPLETCPCRAEIGDKLGRQFSNGQRKARGSLTTIRKQDAEEAGEATA